MNAPDDPAESALKETEQVPCDEWVQGELRLVGGLSERLFRLLATIESTGSINRAARDVGLSYKGAWEMIERANNLSTRVLVSTTIGGRSGGGTKLTAMGKALLEIFSRLQEDHRQFLEQQNRQLAANPDLLHYLRRLIMKASARNQFFGAVAEVHADSIHAEVFVQLKGGDTLVASITRKSVESLGIQTGTDVVALVKAPFVIVATDLGGYRLSARNQFSGTVTRAHKGAVNAEVVIRLPGGDSVAASITNESFDALGLREGSNATAIFKAEAVVLAVAQR